MPTVIGYHDVKDKDHWLASPKREEFFGPLGVTNIRTFTEPHESRPADGRLGYGRRHGCDGDGSGRRGNGARRGRPGDARDPRRGLIEGRRLQTRRPVAVRDSVS